uniref:Uncharacterized protein n=1 Tax=Romanomermis culicivorax TaxID=13658 RepID=A0A915JBA4_ROMCU
MQWLNSNVDLSQTSISPNDKKTLLSTLGMFPELYSTFNTDNGRTTLVDHNKAGSSVSVSTLFSIATFRKCCDRSFKIGNLCKLTNC